MIVHAVRPREHAQAVVTAPLLGLRRLAGRRQNATWVPFDVELLSSRDGRTLDQVDVIYLIGGDFLVVKDAVLPRVERELAPCAELLPLRCPQEPLTLVNVVDVVDALDEEESQVSRFPSSGRVMAVDRHVFRPHAVPPAGLFRIPQAMVTMFCTEATAEVLRERLSGLELQPVWEG